MFISIALLVVAATFTPKTFTVDPGQTYWNEEPKNEVYTPGGLLIARERGGAGDPVRIDTTVQLVDGAYTLKLKKRDRRYKITGLTEGRLPEVQITRRSPDSVQVRTYGWDLVSHKDNNELIITSNENTDTSWVSVSIQSR